MTDNQAEIPALGGEQILGWLNLSEPMFLEVFPGWVKMLTVDGIRVHLSDNPNGFADVKYGKQLFILQYDTETSCLIDPRPVWFKIMEYSFPGEHTHAAHVMLSGSNVTVSKPDNSGRVFIPFTPMEGSE